MDPDEVVIFNPETMSQTGIRLKEKDLDGERKTGTKAGKRPFTANNRDEVSLPGYLWYLIDVPCTLIVH